MMLNMNDKGSLLQNIRRTQEELRGIDNGVFPPVHLVPMEARGRYHDTLRASRRHMIKRYLELLSLDFNVDFSWGGDGYDYDGTGGE